MIAAPSLSKSRFVSGAQCPKRLWLEVHERDADELVPDALLQAIFDRGTRVGEFARSYFPGGVLIDVPHDERDERVRSTQAALRSGAPVIFEACFFEDGVFVGVDALERQGRGYTLVEVKSTTRVKEAHLLDVAIQLHVLRKAGLHVPRAELMHLNVACRAPALHDLFTRTDVTAEVEALQPELPGRIRSQLRMLAGPVPRVQAGAHCDTPYPCPFFARCNAALPAHHVSTLYQVRRNRVGRLLDEGYQTLHDLPPDYAATGVVQRQLTAVQSYSIVVEPGLAARLPSRRERIAFLDFESVAPAIPVWPGTRPYRAVPVQFSCHVQTRTGLRHHAWLASPGRDPRRELARNLVDACAGATTVLAYHAQFERQCLADLIEAVPELASELQDIADRLDDMLPWVRDHVYHPDFAGSFSLKVVAPALLGEDGYANLDVQDGQTASNDLERLLLRPEELSLAELQHQRDALLQYCEQDTLVMVQLLARLRELSSDRIAHGPRASLAP